MDPGEREDGDSIAIRELQRRQNRLTNIIGAGCIVVGLALTALVFIALFELEVQHLGAVQLEWTMVIAMVVGVGGSIAAGVRLRRMILRWRAPSWIAELAANHRQRREELEQIASLWH